MLAIAAAVIFGLALLLDFLDVFPIGDALNASTMMFAGLFCLALHFAGVGTNARVGSRR